ncbi:DUF1990 family protein [Myxococcus virescens]|uniref:Uncharacterized membrane protein n=1 Tax=Myxococcus virescens TaxID=83456 RepID=A0A511HJM7_9BACT|nr:DUF1990 family protein [Myxococcus virescens]GEL73771.1 hypothetical protein MVI01_55550 [Myxococcus virescens]SDE33945.1 Uncharacterized membrane protein [Myxococcus virescens]
MIEWRWFSGWTEEEMVPRLARARTLARNFPEVSGEMTLQGGWSQVRSESVLGREPPGRPVPGGLFERAQQVLETFDFSDPRIVAWHFSDEEPMQGRTVLLELRALGQQLRYLCGVRVGGTREEHDEGCSVFGFSFETLHGHIEAGREWFLLKKEHESGEVRFHIEAAWRPGQFPNWWSRLGFAMVAPRYQRAWHRLTHVRVRELALKHPELIGQLASHGRLAHAGHALGTAPVQFFAQRAPGRRETQLEEEIEAMNRAHGLRALGLGVLAGMRSMSAPALASRWLTKTQPDSEDRLARTLAHPWTPRVLGLLAVGELVADKLPMAPPRVAAVPLTGRMLSGALAAASVTTERQRGVRLAAAALGALAALASSWAFYSLRRTATKKLGVPDVAVALTEDALLAGLASRLLPVSEHQAGQATLSPA